MIQNRSISSDSSVEQLIPHPGFDAPAVPATEDSLWPGGNPAGTIGLSDTELRAALKAARICSENASISTTWCDNPNIW